MANVTYLLGAGASCNCLPTYANFSKRFLEFENIFLGEIQGLNSTEKEYAENILGIIRELKREFQFHSTPDTIAKKYFHLPNGESKLHDLKIILILFFLYEQSVSEEYIVNNRLLKKENKSQIDKRYDSFIAAILEPKFGQVNIPGNFNILTWNYDLQFEISFRNYYQRNIFETKRKLQCVPSRETLTDFKYNNDQFSITHLNGIAFNGSKNDDNILVDYITNRKLLLGYLIEHYRGMRDSKHALEGIGLLNFAWERNESFPSPKHALKLINSFVEEISSKTEVLVIIGYSFPIFNRDVDSYLLEKMQKLKKIYIQSPIAEDLKNVVVEAFGPINKKINEKNIQLITALDYFHIPHEANRKIIEFKVSIR